VSAVKKLKAKDLRADEAEALASQVAKLEQELFQNKLKQMTNQLENTMVIRNARRNIARIRTVLGEKQKAAKAAPEATKG
jgi:large subunit ribosomal protein L29